MLKQCSGRHVDGGWEDGWDELEVGCALHEGDEIEPFEPVMTIEGDYTLFAHLETVYLGCMARRSLVMRNVREVVDAAGGKPILFFPARHDHWLVQTGDGWAAHVAGAIGVSTDAQASWWGGRGVGTVPHALIAAFGGDTVAAARVRRPLLGRDERHRAGGLRQRLGAHLARGGRRAGRQALGRAPRHLRAARRPLALARDGRLQAHRRQHAPGGAGARRARRRRPRARQDRGLGRLRRGQDPRVRGPRHARGRLRSGLRAAARRERLHRGRGAGRGRGTGPRWAANTAQTRAWSGWTDIPVARGGGRAYSGR